MVAVGVKSRRSLSCFEPKAPSLMPHVKACSTRSDHSPLSRSQRAATRVDRVRTRIVAVSRLTRFKRRCLSRRMIRGQGVVARWLRGGGHWLAVALLGCALDERDVATSEATGEPGSQTAAECAEGAAECAAAAGVPRSCEADADCPASAPSCVSAACACTLAVSELSSDEKNCGQCGNDCGSVDIGATCQQGRCIRPGEPGPTSVAQSSGGDVAVLAAASGAALLRSERHSLALSAGQAPGGNLVMKSSRFQLKSGFVGASE
jgi:hypothetical protein